MVSRSEAQELTARHGSFEKKVVVRFFVRYRRSETAKNRVKRNRHRGDDSITETA
jgi:hypothetical protein